jgi:hypothetical protein
LVRRTTFFEEDTFKKPPSLWLGDPGGRRSELVFRNAVVRPACSGRQGQQTEMPVLLSGWPQFLFRKEVQVSNNKMHKDRKWAMIGKLGRKYQNIEFLPAIERLSEVLAQKGLVVRHHGLEKGQTLTVHIQSPNPGNGARRGRVLATYFPTTGTFKVGTKSIYIDSFDGVDEAATRLFVKQASSETVSPQ